MLASMTHPERAIIVNGMVFSMAMKGRGNDWESA